MDVAATLTVVESTPPPVSTKMVQVENQQFPRDEVLGEVTPLIWMLDVFSFLLLPTSEKATTIILTPDLSFFQNLHEGDKMELSSELTRSIFKAVYIFSIISVIQGDVLALGNPSKERGT